MVMVILTLNCGSSSAKYQVYDWDNKDVLAVGVVERIGLEYSTIEHKATGKEEFEDKFSCPTHKEAIELIIKLITDKTYGVIKDVSEIGAVGHRVLHGGEIFKKSALVTDDVVEKLKTIIPLGPLHMPANIMGIEAARKVMPNVPHAIVMDTAFHQTMPPEAYMYAVPYEWYEKFNVRRYGFHGTSHLYCDETCEELTQSLARLVDENGMDWMYSNCSQTAQHGALKWRPFFRKATEPVFKKLYASTKKMQEAKEVIRDTGRPDYKEFMAAKLQAMHDSEMWKAGEAVRALRPHEKAHAGAATAAGVKGRKVTK